MKAIVQDRYGSPDVLAYGEVEKPEAGEGDVLVRVHAAGVDRGVWHLMAGLPYLVRIMGYGFRRPTKRVPGMDVAGIVEAVGSGVTRFRPGDRVFGEISGAYAEYASAPATSLEAMPANLGFEQAAALAISGRTALRAVREMGEVTAGQRVLVIGASGGVGSYAVQIAKAYGAEVTGVCSTSKVDLVRSIGADHVIDYTREDFTDGNHKYDVILDMGGNRPLRRLRRALTERGTLVIVGGEAGGRWLGGIGRGVWASLLSGFVSQNLRMQVPGEQTDDLRVLKELVETGKVTPTIDRTFPLEEAADAIRYLVSGKARGKIVLTLGGAAAPTRRPPAPGTSSGRPT
jgi:NADPH:quinone reductase-like Zn-dependent oxidoreductase